MTKILLIEDNSLIAENLTEYLEIEGFQIAVANNGKMGIQLAGDLPDLILCDVLMPDIDGYKVLSTLLGNIKTAQIPFIFSTSMSEKFDRAESLKLGAGDYIVKPYELEILLKMINYWIWKGTSRQAKNKQPFIN